MTARSEQLRLDLTAPSALTDEPGPMPGRGEPESEGELPDEAARRRIETDLDTNILVEAAAGSGKTTALVRRMVALIREGTADVHEIAAVTFTRKAAGELRQRFQEALEEELASQDIEPDRRAALDVALQQIDRAFMGTIHAFCARLLRERPLEAGIDPDFTEVTAAEARTLATRFWSLHLERLATQGDPILGELEEMGLHPIDLRSLYDEVRENPDVDLPATPIPPPDPELVEWVRTQVNGLLDEAARCMPQTEPERGFDPLQQRLKLLSYIRRFRRWEDDRVFLDALGELASREVWSTTYKRWAEGAGGEAGGRQVQAEVNRVLKPDGPARRLLMEWWAYRYPIAVRFARDAARALEVHRRSAGTLDFQDLLVLAARLLRDNAGARRDLGGRWRRILVDEFQDTDPLQAEVVFLLASDRNAGEDGDEDNGVWTRSVPRPGALFVVGDPKQSIYRFRRADIALYLQVRGRFLSFGDVVELQSNFRSVAPLCAFVNDAFAPPDGLFAAGRDEGTQAEFARLVPQQRASRPREGAFFYEVPAERRTNAARADWGAEALADWIARRVGPGGDRKPGDFLVLTRLKKPLERYARALEARDLPLQVSGAGVGVDEEVGELRLVLRALEDPQDPSLTVAVLVGLFFGLDHEQLLSHRLAGRAFDFRLAPSPVGKLERASHADDAVEAALSRMKGWWEVSKEHPADVVVERIADDVGLLPFAAAGSLGSIRAGALAFVLDAVRGSGLAGDTSLAGALDALAAALDDDDAEAPLEPGRANVIRLMNVHKAKGLEAPVVVLAAPFGERERPILRHVERGSDGSARAWMCVERRDGRSHRVLARPRDWEQKVQSEKAFRAAENVRLLYVATTRAADELVIACSPTKPAKSAWAPLDSWLDRHGSSTTLQPTPPPERRQLEVTPEELKHRTTTADTRRTRASREGYRFLAVTHLAKRGERLAAPEGVPTPALTGESGPGGYTWGSAVHTLLEAAGRGVSGAALRELGRVVLLELDRPTHEGRPVELDDLLATVGRVLDSSLWVRASRAEQRLLEVPFATRWPDDGRPSGPKWEAGRTSTSPASQSYLEGVIDLAFREHDGWVIADYKTDRGDDPEFTSRVATYREQLRLYGAAWAALTREPVKERLLWFVRSGEVETV